MGTWLFSISHWGMFPIEPDWHQSYWDHLWWLNSGYQGAERHE
jgi:hypothetical protein